MNYASRTSRLVAQVLDDLIAAGPFVIADFFVSDADGVGTALIILSAGWAIYYVLFSDGFSNGQSLGKRALDIRVVDATSKSSCTFGQSVVRNLMLGLLGPIDWVFIFGERHQRLGDKAAGTVVIRVGAG